MQYWLVPCRVSMYDIDKAIAENNGYCWWRQTNRFAVGDVVFVYMSKPLQCIRYCMEVTDIDVAESEELLPEKYWKDKDAYYNNFGFNKLSRFELRQQYDDDKYPLAVLHEHGLNKFPQSTRIIEGELLDFFLNDDYSEIDPAGDPERGTDYVAEDNLWEGAVDEVLANRYERNHKAREECIRLKGCRCYICGFDFEEAYGPIGKNFIHVHHVVPISKIGKNYKLNVATDLIPVCPNCHAMLHSKPGAHEAYTPDELRQKILGNLQAEYGSHDNNIHIGKLYKIEDDPSIKSYIDNKIEILGDDVRILSVVSGCQARFGEFYPNMTTTDWYHAINSYTKRTDDSDSKAAEPEINDN